MADNPSIDDRRLSWRSALRSDLKEYWPLWVIVVAAVALRLWDMGRVPGINGDEAWYGVQAQQLLAGQAIDWRTPTGNVPGLLQIGSLWILHSVFPPSLLLLRIPALLSSFGAMAMAYAVGRRFFDARAGMAALLMMACFPIVVAYARFGWDPSHSPVLALIAIYAALARRRLLSALVFAFALSNHPSSVFIAPFLTLALLGAGRAHGGWRPALLSAAAFVGLLLLAILFSFLLSVGASQYLDFGESAARIVDPQQAMAFMVGFGRLLSGDTIYRFVAGAGFGAARPVIDVATALLLVAIGATGIFALYRRPEWSAIGLVFGWFASLAALYVVTGPWALNPGLERFAFPMIPLTALALATLVSAVFANGRRHWLFQPLVAAVTLPMLAGYCHFMLRPLDRGTTSPLTAFWTGEVEPRQAAFDWIAAAGPVGGRIIAEDWWLSEPIAYYSAGSNFVVANANEGIASGGKAATGDIYWVTYRGGPLDRALDRRSDVRRRGVIGTSNAQNSLQIWSGGNGR